MDKIRSMIQKALDEMDKIEKERDGEKDAEKQKALTETIEKKGLELEALNKDLEQAIKETERKAKATELSKKSLDLSKAVVTDKASLSAEGAAVGKDAAEAIDHAETERLQVKAFTSYLKGGRNAMSGQEVEALAPNAQLFKRGSEGCRVPKSIQHCIMPSQFEWARKALPMVSSSATQGGNTIPQDFRELLMTPLPQPTAFDFITLVPSKTGTVTWPKLSQSATNKGAGEFGSVTVTWTTEGSSKDDTEAAFEQIIISTSELEAYTEISHQLLSRSAVDLEALLTQMFKGAIRYEIDRTIMVGSGTTQPWGLAGYSGVKKVARATANQVKFADIINLEGAIEPYHLPGSIFMLNNKAWTNLQSQVDSQARPLFLDNTGMGMFPKLHGYPYALTTHLPNLGQSGDVYFGNLKQYIGVMEQDVVVRRSDDYQFKKNVAAFATFCLFGGRPLDGRVFAQLGTTAGS